MIYNAYMQNGALESFQHLGVALFLKEFKALMENKKLYFVNRKAHMNSLNRLGLTKEICIELLFDLSLVDYCRGPVPDKDLPGNVWIFGKTIDGCEIYIKLKIADASDERIAKCISFHPAKHPICYPYK